MKPVYAIALYCISIFLLVMASWKDNHLPIPVVLLIIFATIGLFKILRRKKSN